MCIVKIHESKRERRKKFSFTMQEEGGLEGYRVVEGSGEWQSVVKRGNGGKG